MNCGHGIDTLETQRREFCGASGCLKVVSLVHHQQHRLLDRPQLLRNLLVQWNDALLDIDHEEDHIRSIDSQVHLLQSGSGDHIIGFFPTQQPDAASIHQGVRATVPFSLGHHTVSSNTGLVMNNGDATADDSIEER